MFTKNLSRHFFIFFHIHTELLFFNDYMLPIFQHQVDKNPAKEGLLQNEAYINIWIRFLCSKCHILHIPAILQQPHISSFCFYIAVCLGMIIAIVISNYYIYLAIGAPAAMLSFIHSNFLRSEGMSKESMMGTILGAVVNIVLDPFFISILGIGIPAASVNLMQSVSVVLMNQFLLPFGNEKLQQWELS